MSERIPIEKLEETEEFKSLTPKQKLFVQTYIASNYDRVVSIQTAFGCKNEKSARCFSYAVLKHPKIIAVMNIHFGTDPREEWLRMLERAAMRKDISATQLLAIKILGEAKGFLSSIPVHQTGRSVEFDHEKVAQARPDPSTKKRGRPRKNSKNPVEEKPKTSPYGDW